MSNKNWHELTNDQHNDIKTKLNCEVKVKIKNGRIVAFNPFSLCASNPPKYKLKWLPINENEKPQTLYMFSHEVFSMIANVAIESDNIEYLNECKFDTTNIKLNLNIDDDHI